MSIIGIYYGHLFEIGIYSYYNFLFQVLAEIETNLFEPYYNHVCTAALPC